MTGALLGIIFLLGYLAISLENPLKVHKSATALMLGVLCWLIYSLSDSTNQIDLPLQLGHHLEEIAEILFFLMGAMIIVELIDTYQGFRVITNLIKTNSKTALLWIVCFLAFFLSAILDNLTTSIVMVSILRKLLDDKKERIVFASMVIIAANAGGAWSPIGDVTTTMLWIGGQITAAKIMKALFLPSLVSLLVPLLFQSFFVKGKFTRPANNTGVPLAEPNSFLIFILGIACLIFVPVFKLVTHLPPYMGMLFGLSVMWIVTEIINTKKEEHRNLRVASILQKIDLNSILFFLGILLAVAALQSAGVLMLAADWLDAHIASKEVIAAVLGLSSAIIDNVPLVAATTGMYGSAFPTDHKFWEMIAYATGTGGSILIIGSAAGVIVMGMEEISFGWYLKRISQLALLGYVAGLITYLLIG